MAVGSIPKYVKGEAIAMPVARCTWTGVGPLVGWAQGSEAWRWPCWLPAHRIDDSRRPTCDGAGMGVFRGFTAVQRGRTVADAMP